MNIKKKFVSTLLLTAAFCVSPAINVMAEDATTMQTETLDSAIDNSSEVEGQEAENIQTSSTDENESDGEIVNIQYLSILHQIQKMKKLMSL